MTILIIGLTVINIILFAYNLLQEKELKKLKRESERIIKEQTKRG